MYVDRLATVNEFAFSESELEDKFLESMMHRKQIEFINTAAHEFKAPLQTILTYSEMLNKNPQKSTLYVETILRNAKRLQRLTRNLLDISRLENQSLKLNMETFDLTELVSYAVADLVPSLSKKYQNLTVTKPTSAVFVHADKERIMQVICNLLANAIKFTADGVISIGVDKRNKQHDDVVLTIKDSGLGIDPSIMPVLFSKFASTSSEGLGLGLFITKSIIDAHGGSIWAHNNHGENGATFSFSLPM